MPKNSPPAEALELFLSYAREDAGLCLRLKKQLSFLRRTNVSVWYDGEIMPGEEWHAEIRERLESADLILLLISADFTDSDFCYEVEMGRAMERHNAGEAVVVPVILSPCHWQAAPFAKLQALPADGTAVTQRPDVETALYEVAMGVGKVVDKMLAERAASAPPPAAARPAARPHVAPPPAVGFVPRRDREGRDLVERLREELSQGPAGLVVLWGEGGVGKTTIAAETARALAPAYGGRVVWVSAENRHDFDYPALLNEVAARLGAPDLAQLATGPKEQAVVGLLAAAPALLVLDNFETVAADDKRACADFLARANCPVLVGTRERVAHEHARHVHVETMSGEEARLFVARWIEREAREPEVFEGLDRDEIIRAADARPFVLQSVLAQIDLELEPRGALEELARAEGEVGARVFARSFNLPHLGDDARAVLLALSLFTPSALRPALAEVAGFGDDEGRLREAVRRLSALRLVSAARGGQRLRVEGLTRGFARSRLSADERADDFRRRFVAHFARHAEAHERTTPEDVAALDAEKENVLGALDVAFKLKDWESVIRIRSKLELFLRRRGYLDEAIRSGELAVAAAREAKNEAEAMAFKGNLAMIFKMRGEYARAAALHRETVEYFQRAGMEQNVAVGLHELGDIAQEQGDLPEAERLYIESLEIKRRLGDLRGGAHSLHHMGLVRQEQGELAAAERYYNTSLAISRQVGDAHGVTISLNQLGAVALARGERARARLLFGEGLELNRRLGDETGVAIGLNNLGLIAEQEHDPAEAARLFRESLRIAERLNLPEQKMVRESLARVEGAAV